MADHNDGGVLRRLIVADVLQNALAPRRVQPRRRLVKDEHVRLHGDHARDGDAPLLPAGQVKRRALQLRLRNAHKTRRAQHALVNFILAETHIFRSERDVAVRGLFKKLRLGVLEHQPHTKAHLPREFFVLPNILTVKQHAPGGWLKQPVQVLDERGLARAGVPDQPQKFTALYFQAHILKRDVLKGRPGAVQV